MKSLSNPYYALLKVTVQFFLMLFYVTLWLLLRVKFNPLESLARPFSLDKQWQLTSLQNLKLLRPIF